MKGAELMGSEKIRDSLPLIVVGAFAMITVVMILLGIMTCKLPVVMVCVVVLLETAIAVCLHNLPIWLHCVVLLAEIITGVFCGQVLFMVCAGVVYAMAIVTIHFLGTE